MNTPTALMHEHPAVRATRLAPFDDEPETAEERLAVEQARSYDRAHPEERRTSDELRRELGL